MTKFEYKPFSRRNLPHLAPLNCTLFITCRLVGSIPQKLVREYKSKNLTFERELFRLRKLTQNRNTPAMLNFLAEFENLHREWFVKFDKLMDRAVDGPMWLKNERAAAALAKQIHHLDDEVFRLDAYCVMSNHLHIVFAPLLNERSLTEERDELGHILFLSDVPGLSKIMQQLKGTSARECNQALARTGQFWERESFDHVVRQGRLMRTVKYVLNNPVKAGLVDDWKDWRWSYCRKELLDRL